MRKANNSEGLERGRQSAERLFGIPPSELG